MNSNHPKTFATPFGIAAPRRFFKRTKKPIEICLRPLKNARKAAPLLPQAPLPPKTRLKNPTRHELETSPCLSLAGHPIALFSRNAPKRPRFRPRLFRRRNPPPLPRTTPRPPILRRRHRRPIKPLSARMPIPPSQPQHRNTALAKSIHGRRHLHALSRTSRQPDNPDL